MVDTKYFNHKELLTPPIRRTAYSDRTGWLLAEMSRLAYLVFKKDDVELKSTFRQKSVGFMKTMKDFYDFSCGS